MQGIPARLTMTARNLQQRCAEICSFSEAPYSVSGWRWDDQICKLVAARGPIQLLRRFNSGSRRQRRVSEEGSSSLKKINLRCGGEDAPPILVGYGGLHSALVHFFILHEPMDVQLHCVIEIWFSRRGEHLFFPDSVS